MKPTTTAMTTKITIGIQAKVRCKLVADFFLIKFGDAYVSIAERAPDASPTSIISRARAGTRPVWPGFREETSLPERARPRFNGSGHQATGDGGGGQCEAPRPRGVPPARRVERVRTNWATCAFTQISPKKGTRGLRRSMARAPRSERVQRKIARAPITTVPASNKK